MKIRNGFVTNSSSTNFGAAGLEVIYALIMLLLGLCSEEEENNEQDSENMVKYVMPEENCTLKCDNNPVWLYAKIVEDTEDGGEKTNTDATSGIKFEVTSGSDWVRKGTEQLAGDWQAIDIYGKKSPTPDGKPPEKVIIKASGELNGKKLKTTFNIDFEAPPELKLDPKSVKLLSGTGDTKDVKFFAENAKKDRWKIFFKPDAEASKLCVLTQEDDGYSFISGVLTVREDDTTNIKKIDAYNYHSEGKIDVKLESDNSTSEDKIDVTIYREGLFILNGVSEYLGYAIVNAFEVEGELKPTEVEICYLRWDENQQKVVFAPEKLKEFEDGSVAAEDSESTNVFRASGFEFKFSHINEYSDISTAVFKMSVKRVVPGKGGDSFKGTINLRLDNFFLDIPVQIKPADHTTSSSWEQEYQNCIAIITKYVPPDIRQEKLDKLENDKYAMGVQELYDYRHECWNIARDILVKEGQDYLAEAQKWDDRIFYAEVVKWLADKSFSAVASVAFGPFGAFITGQVYDSLCDIMAVCVNKWNTDWYTIGMDIIWKRVGGFSDKALEKYQFSSPEFALKWVAQYTAYKVLWHWFWDYDGNNRKGFMAAVTSTRNDLVGVAFKEGMKNFLGEAVKKNLLSGDKNNVIDEKIEEYGGDKAVDYLKVCLDNIAYALQKTRIIITWD
jgi:hypothetical protein